jgi:hypothetical protein
VITEDSLGADGFGRADRLTRERISLRD